MTIEWNPIQQFEAQEEGWGIFKTGSEDRPFQLQALDDGYLLWQDLDAWNHVYDKAHAGSLLHQNAMNFLHEHSPAEFEAIIDECSPDGRELNDEFQWPLV